MHLKTLSVKWQPSCSAGDELRKWCCIVTSVALTHWGRVTHICVGEQTIIGSDNGLSPGRRQAIIWTNTGILLTGPLGTNFSEILIGIQIFSFKKMPLKMSSAKWRPFCLGLNVLTSVWLSVAFNLYLCCPIHVTLSNILDLCIVIVLKSNIRQRID